MLNNAYPAANITSIIDKNEAGRMNNPKFPYLRENKLLYAKTFCKKPEYHLSLCFVNGTNFLGETVNTYASIAFSI